MSTAINVSLEMVRGAYVYNINLKWSTLVFLHKCLLN